jgi:hypothetical protein
MGSQQLCSRFSTFFFAACFLASILPGAIYAQWGTPVIVDNSGNTTYGEGTSMAIVNGNPAIAYQNHASEDLMYVRALDAAGTSWGTPISLDAAGHTGYSPSLAVVDGYPAIAYYDDGSEEMKYVRALDAAGTSWSSSMVLDTSITVNFGLSLMIVNGNPAIAYSDSHRLKYIRAGDAAGAAWGSPVTITSGDYMLTGNHNSMAIVNGFPAISFFHDIITAQDLMFVRATNASGSAWESPLSIDTTGNVGFYTSLAIVNGNPAISYLDGLNADLKFVRATNADGSAWGSPISLDTDGNVGSFTSLAIVNGFPAISYRDLVNHALKYIRATNASGTSWGTPVQVDVSEGAKTYTTLTIVNGFPAISYYDNTHGYLKYVRATNANGVNDSSSSSYIPPVTAPTVSTWGLVLLTAVIAGVSLWRLRL